MIKSPSAWTAGIETSFQPTEQTPHQVAVRVDGGD